MSGDSSDSASDHTGADTAEAAGSTTDDVERLSEISAELSAVESSLRRLDDGTHGTCEVCGAPLDAAQMEGQPALARCPAHTD